MANRRIGGGLTERGANAHGERRKRRTGVGLDQGVEGYLVRLATGAFLSFWFFKTSFLIFACKAAISCRAFAICSSRRLNSPFFGTAIDYTGVA
jgi:hypothetical protein